MNLTNKLLMCVCLLFLISVTGCGTSDKHQKAYDSVEQIAQQGDSYSYVNRLCSEKSKDKIKLKYDGFSGTDTIWILESKEDGEITVNYDSTIKNGNFKVVLAYPDTKEIENISEGTEQGNKTIKLKKGESRLKLVGKNAAGDLKIALTETKNLEKITTKKD